MSDPPQPRRVVIIGAGVIGLTIAHVLSSGPYKITIVARDMPEDLDSQGFASPWAGANWSPINRGLDERSMKWEVETFNKFWDMIPTGLVMKVPSRVYHMTNEANTWYKDLVRDFHILPAEEIPDNFKIGFGFNTISVSPPHYLSWLKSELLGRGVQFVRKTIQSLSEVATFVGPNGILVNASSLGSRSIHGVMDTTLYPIRGQTILVRSSGITEFYDVDDINYETGEVTYAIPRPGGTVLLGGTFQPNNWDTSVDLAAAEGIFERCAALVPPLRDKETKIISHNVGLRPARRDGPRVELEWVRLPLTGSLIPESDNASEEYSTNPRNIMVMHAYGFGPAGYQTSWGVAEEVASVLQLEITSST